jgi:hypothetical protein
VDGPDYEDYLDLCGDTNYAKENFMEQEPTSDVYNDDHLDWDFTSGTGDWKFLTSTGYPYPVLSWQTSPPPPPPSEQ